MQSSLATKVVKPDCIVDKSGPWTEVDWSGSWTAVDQSEPLYVDCEVGYNMSVLTQLTVPGKARPLKKSPRRRFIRLVFLKHSTPSKQVPPPHFLSPYATDPIFMENSICGACRLCRLQTPLNMY